MKLNVVTDKNNNDTTITQDSPHDILLFIGINEHFNFEYEGKLVIFSTKIDIS